MSCGCADEKVKVEGSDNTGYLYPKIEVVAPLTKELGGVSGSRTVRLGIDMPCQPIVESSDSSITVTPVTIAGCTTYSIKANCCENNDKYVAVGIGCEPGYLENVLKADSPLVATKVGCTYRISLDPAAIPDKKVAVDSDCNGDYLRYVLRGTDGVSFNKVACQYVGRIDTSRTGWIVPTARIALASSYRLFCTANTTLEVPMSGLSHTYSNVPAMIATGNRITITKAGDYWFSMLGTVEINDGIHALRIEIDSNKSRYIGRIMQKYGGGTSLPETEQGGVAYPLYNITDGGLKTLTYTGGTLLDGMEVGDRVSIKIKMDTRVSPSATHNVAGGGDINIVGNNGGLSTPNQGGEIGFSLSCYGINTIYTP